MMKQPAIYARLKAHFLTEAHKDTARGLTHPTVRNVLASLLCVLLLLAWAAWVWYVGWNAWCSGQAHYRTADVSAATSPIRYGLVLMGCGFLGAYSLDGAVQYAVEAVCRIQRMRSNRMEG